LPCAKSEILDTPPENYRYFRTVIFITGSTGIVGTRIMFDLLERGLAVKALKRKNSDLDFVKRVFVFYSGEKGIGLFNNIQWVEGDILDVALLERYLAGVEQVYHCAALVSYQPRDEEKLLRINQEGTANLVNAALAAGVKRLCHISSVAAMGRKTGKRLTDEKTAWERKANKSNYSLSKFLSEQEVWRGMAEGLPAVIVNPSIILGPSKAKQSSGMLVNILLSPGKSRLYRCARCSKSLHPAYGTGTIGRAIYSKRPKPFL
jgi:nucleoside-diphosphate-sugar epimerase